jgi:hypothetical protein
MKFIFLFWDVLSCKIMGARRFSGPCGLIALMMAADRTSETSVDNYFIRQYIPEDKSELYFSFLQSVSFLKYVETFHVLLR